MRGILRAGQGAPAARGPETPKRQPRIKRAGGCEAQTVLYQWLAASLKISTETLAALFGHADEAFRFAEAVSSAMIRSKLRDLLADSVGYARVPRDREFRKRLHATIANLELTTRPTLSTRSCSS